MTTALFLGRFQPPHVGHLLTLRKLATAYSKVIVGVTESEPSVMPVPRIMGLLEELLLDDTFEFIHVKGSVELGTAIIDCNFDVCCSGNPAVLRRMEENGYQVEYTERSQDKIYSGTKERSEYVDNAIAIGNSRSQASLTEFKIVKTKDLRPLEKINPNHYFGIEADILSCGVMNKPLIVDRSSMTVLDGSHRYALLLKHGFELAPVIMCDYDNESIFVGNHLGHRFKVDEKKWISKQHVRATAISGNLYEPRTTRHFFPFRKDNHPTELSTLQAAEPRDITHLIASVTKEQELAKNEEYIDELKYELSTLKGYVEEQQKVREWLIRQNEYISKNG